MKGMIAWTLKKHDKKILPSVIIMIVFLMLFPIIYCTIKWGETALSRRTVFPMQKNAAVNFSYSKRVSK